MLPTVWLLDPVSFHPHQFNNSIAIGYMSSMDNTVKMTLVLLAISTFTSANVIRSYAVDSFPDSWNASVEDVSIAVANLSIPVNWTQTMTNNVFDEEPPSNSSREARTHLYYRLWREKMVAPNVEAGSSSSESLDSWSMECDCKQTTKTTKGTTTTTTATTPSTTHTTLKETVTTTATTPRTVNTTTAPSAFDDATNSGDDSIDADFSLQIGDRRWRKRYRAWLRRCGCDKYNNNN